MNHRDWKRTHRNRMAEIRTHKAESGECRQCKKPAAYDKNGKLLKMCQFHLDEDRARVARRDSKRRKAKARG